MKRAISIRVASKHRCLLAIACHHSQTLLLVAMAYANGITFIAVNCRGFAKITCFVASIEFFK
jgi:hypothetical protein